MNRRVQSLTEHFRYIALAKQSSAVCVEFLEQSFRRFGPVQTERFENVASALPSFLPLKSFTTRYLILEAGAWCLCVTDMIGESCFVDVCALSKTTRCVGLAGEFGELRRSFCLMENGEVRRSISCYRDGAQWFFEQMGAPLDFEMVEHYARRERSERLAPEVVAFYLTCASEISFPINFQNVKFTSVAGVRRSLEKLRVPLEHFQVSEL